MNLKFIAGACLLAVGCMEASPLVVSDRVDLSPLATQAKNPSDLVSVNSLCLLPVTFRPNIVKVPKQEVQLALADAAKSELSIEVIDLSATAPQSIRSAAQKSGCDSLLNVELSKFTERTGSLVGSREGAEIAFSFAIERLRDSKKVWSAGYNFVDKALSEDVIAFGKSVASKGGIGWSSAGRMMRNGFLQGLREFNAQRTQLFLKH